jgi:hypothetical protein
MLAQLAAPPRYTGAASAARYCGRLVSAAKPSALLKVECLGFLGRCAGRLAFDSMHYHEPERDFFMGRA